MCPVSGPELRIHRNPCFFNYRKAPTRHPTKTNTAQSMRWTMLITSLVQEGKAQRLSIGVYHGYKNTPLQNICPDFEKNKTPPTRFGQIFGSQNFPRAKRAKKIGFLGRYARGNRLKSIIFGTPKSVRFEKK